MKFLFFILLFAAIVAFGITSVAPALQDCVEGHLEIKAKEVLNDSKLAKKYTFTGVVMDHFHVKQVTLKPKGESVDEKYDSAQVQNEIAETIDPVLGIYAQDFAVVSLNSTPEKKTSIIPETPEVGPAPPDETPDLAVIKNPVSFSIKWNAVDKELFLKGRQTNKHAGSELAKFFKEAKKNPKIKSSIRIDTNKVANSKYLMRALRDIRLLVKNSESDLDIEFQDVIKTSDGMKKGFLKYKGITGNFEKYEALTKSIQNLENDEFEVHNELKFYPYVAIRKDALKEIVTLTGCVENRADQGMLGSNASRGLANNFRTDNKLTTHKRCLDITWLDEHAEKLIADHMKMVADGEIIYRNNKLYSLSGVSYDSDYVAEVKSAYPEIAKKLIYKEAPLKRIELVEPDPERPETLAEQLEDYKIYFGSGKYNVDPRYKKQLDEIASKIKASTDKTSQILIGGYADTSGYAAQNKVLSLKRAKSVMSKLVSRGVDPKRIELKFFGAEEANSEDTKAESRRVEIKIRKK